MKVSNKKNEPNLRFKGFSEEWETTMLGDYTSPKMCKRIMKDETSIDGEIPFYKIGTFGGMADSFITNELFTHYKEKFNYPVKGEVMISCSGTVGKCIRFDGSDSYFQDSNIVWLKNDEKKIINSFLYIKLANFNWGKLNSTTIKRIYNDDLKRLELEVPSCKEQLKISQLLMDIERLINLKENELKLEKLNKKGIISQLYKTVEDCPKERLDKLVKSSSSNLKDSNINDVGKYKAYGAKGHIGYSEEFLFKEESVAIVKDGSVGRTMICDANSAVTSTLNYFTTKSLTPTYLKLVLDRINFNKYAEGSTIQHIYFNEYGKELISVPSSSVQNRISDIIININYKLELMSQELDQLKKIKEGLLKNMLI